MKKDVEKNTIKRINEDMLEMNMLLASASVILDQHGIQPDDCRTARGYVLKAQGLLKKHFPSAWGD